MDMSDLLYNAYSDAQRSRQVIKKIKRMKSVSPPRPGAKSPGRHRSPLRNRMGATAAQGSSMLGNVAAQATVTTQASSSNSVTTIGQAAAEISSSAKGLPPTSGGVPSLAAAVAATKNSNTGTETTATAAEDSTPKSSVLHRASSSGKQPAVDQNFTLSSPRYKFDVERNKFVIVQEKSPTRGFVKNVLRPTAEQLSKRRMNRLLNDAAAMRILAPMLNPPQVKVLTDVSQVIPSRRGHHK